VFAAAGGILLILVAPATMSKPSAAALAKLFPSLISTVQIKCYFLSDPPNSIIRHSVASLGPSFYAIASIAGPKSGILFSTPYEAALHGKGPLHENLRSMKFLFHVGYVLGC